MNNSVRALVQLKYESAMMENLGGRVEGLQALEIGCGRGVGTEIIFERFKAREVHAFDIDPEMSKLARQRLKKYLPQSVRLYVGDAERIEADDASYDTVFDFGIIHHIPIWKNAVAEVARVLKPTGRFFFEEVTEQALDRWLYRTFLKHPVDNRFTGQEFVAELEKQGIIIANNLKYWFLNDFIIGVGRRI